MCTFNKIKLFVVFQEPQFSLAAIIVPVIAAFITLLVLWILLIVHARYFGSLKNMTEPTTSQPLNRSVVIGMNTLKHHNMYSYNESLYQMTIPQIL